MCGRARLSSDVSEIKIAFGIPPERPTPNIAPSWNLAPTDPAPVVYYDAKDGGRRLEVMRWGLIPYWAKDIKIGFSTINARAEEVDTKPAFREAFQRRRIPVAQVLSSEWCRCRDTAELAFGRYETWNALNNLFGRPENAESQKRAMLERASRFQGPGNLILVSHGATIVTVAGVSPAPAEMVVMRPAGAGKLEFVGRMPAPPG